MFKKLIGALVGLAVAPSVASGAVIETVNLHDFVLQESQIAQDWTTPVGFDPIDNWTISSTIATTSLDAGDSIEFWIDFSPHQSLLVRDGSDFGTLVGILILFPLSGFPDGTNVYDQSVTFTGIGGDLLLNGFTDNITKDTTIFGENLFGVFNNLTDTYFSFKDLHITLTALEDLTLSSQDFFVILRSDEIEIVPEPSTLTLFLVGLAGLGFLTRRWRKAA
jgi:hypothetical protein